ARPAVPAGVRAAGPRVPVTDPAFRSVEREVDERVRGLLAVQGSRSVDWFHRELGKVLWDNCGMERSADSLKKALGEIPPLREEFHADARVLGENATFNQWLETPGPATHFPAFPPP